MHTSSAGRTITPPNPNTTAGHTETTRSRLGFTTVITEIAEGGDELPPGRTISNTSFDRQQGSAATPSSPSGILDQLFPTPKPQVTQAPTNSFIQNIIMQTIPPDVDKNVIRHLICHLVNKIIIARDTAHPPTTRRSHEYLSLYYSTDATSTIITQIDSQLFSTHADVGSNHDSGAADDDDPPTSTGGEVSYSSSARMIALLLALCDKLHPDFYINPEDCLDRDGNHDEYKWRSELIKLCICESFNVRYRSHSPSPSRDQRATPPPAGTQLLSLEGKDKISSTTTVTIFLKLLENNFFNELSDTKNISTYFKVPTKVEQIKKNPAAFSDNISRTVAVLVDRLPSPPSMETLTTAATKAVSSIITAARNSLTPSPQKPLGKTATNYDSETTAAQPHSDDDTPPLARRNTASPQDLQVSRRITPPPILVTFQADIITVPAPTNESFPSVVADCSLLFNEITSAQTSGSNKIIIFNFEVRGSQNNSQFDGKYCGLVLAYNKKLDIIIFDRPAAKFDLKQQNAYFSRATFHDITITASNLNDIKSYLETEVCGQSKTIAEIVARLNNIATQPRIQECVAASS